MNERSTSFAAAGRRIWMPGDVVMINTGNAAFVGAAPGGFGNL